MDVALRQFAGQPEARAVRRQHLVHQRQRAVLVQAELELGVGDHDAAGQGMGGGGLIEADGGVAHLGRALGPQQAFELREADVLVVIAHGGLGGRREDGRGQGLRHGQACRQGDAADRAAAAVLLPARTGHVAPHHGLAGQGREALDEHAAALHLGHFVGGDHAVRRLSGQVVGDQGLEVVEPEQGHGRQQPALARHGRLHHHVEGAEPVAGHHQQALVAHGVEVAHLAAGDQRQGMQGRAGHGGAEVGECGGGHGGAPRLAPA